MQQRWDTNRIEAFSDGVFAIAVTLLVLDLSLPERDLDHFWNSVGGLWPSYLAYATSFITIGGIWMAHHAIFRRLELANQTVMRINLLLLMAVAFLPFPTSLLAEALHHDVSVRAAVVFYGGSLLVISVLFWALWSAVARHPELLKPDVSDEEVRAIQRATTPNLAFYLLVIVVATFVPKVAAVGYLVVAVITVLRARSDQRAPFSVTGPGHTL
jgi:uncharacterized membrane protein